MKFWKMECWDLFLNYTYYVKFSFFPSSPYNKGKQKTENKKFDKSFRKVEKLRNLKVLKLLKSFTTMEEFKVSV